MLHTGITEDDLINVFRPGRNQDPDTPRHVIIQFASYTSKNLTMESLYRLKNTEKKFKGVVIAHDVTRTERDECKRLVAEAKDNTSGEFMYRVRGPPGNLRIVKIKLDPNLDEFTVLYTNIDCLPNKIQELSQYINLQDKPPDVIALTEIKYKNKWHLYTSELTIHGYHLLSNNLQENTRGIICLLYTSPSPRDRTRSRMPSSA